MFMVLNRTKQHFEIPLCFWFQLSPSNLLLKVEKFLVLYLGCGYMTFNFTTKITLSHLLLSFIRVMKNSFFDQHFLYVYG